MSTYKKPLGRSIAIGCIIFTAILCFALSILNYYNQKRSLYQRYQTYLTDILSYVQAHIDDEDLKVCIETTEESETYKETLKFMDEIMDHFDIHYLYAIKPLNLNETGNVMSVLSAEDYYNRNVDTEGNLYLGWISDDEYDVETVKKFYEIMDQDDIVFFVEKTQWSTDYTGAVPLKDDKGRSYAILAVDVDITTMARELQSQALRNTAVILFLGIVYTISFLSWTKANITNPVRLLEKSVVDYAQKSHGQRNLGALKFKVPPINTENEVESLARAIARMTVNMQGYVIDILTAEERTRNMKALADTMSELAVVDNLTGIRNKTGYSNEEEKLKKELAANRDLEFGMVMIDLNYLKVINDTYGHDKGDEAIRTLSKIACTVFAHSPVFRVGGDEFVVVLRGQDYHDIEKLKERFFAETSGTVYDEPWKNVSASIGIAFYDKEIDSNVGDVLKRADQLMYEMKKKNKADRK